MDEAIVLGDREELAERVDQDIDPATVDIHKDTVDDLTITEAGVVYERVPDVFDVWLDSAVASWGALDYPGEKERHEQLWPADLVIEAHDQTRGWFWSQLGMGTVAVDQVPYETLVMHGHALMPDGRAMSKSKDIRIDPHEVIEEYGADPMRLSLLSVTPRGEDMNFSWDRTETMQRRLNILWNVVRFPLPYMAEDGFDPDAVALDDVTGNLEVVDRWVLSRLASTAETVTDAMEGYENDRAVEALLEFVVEDVSRFYVQEVRERMWAASDSPSKRAAYATLYRVLEDTVAMLAPFAPLVAEELYGALTGERGTRRSTWRTGPNRPWSGTRGSKTRSRRCVPSRRRGRTPASAPSESSAGRCPVSSSTSTTSPSPRPSEPAVTCLPTGSTPARSR